MNHYINKGFNFKKVLFIPNSIKSDFYIKRNKNKIVNILSVGRFHMQKDYKTAIAVINNLKSSSLKFSYTIVGYGELENEIKSYINKYDLNKIVRLKIKPKNLHEIYKSSDIFFQTSLYEGISNTILEAMTFSLPIVCTNSGDNDYIIKENYNGFVANSKDVSSLSKYLQF